MNVEQLQEYLDVEKWHESESRGHDMCGRYARCRYCNRFEPYPCAHAHNRLVAMLHSSKPEPIPAWLLPEPPVDELVEEVAPTAFEEEVACAMAEPIKEQPKATVVTVKKEGRIRLLTIARKRTETTL